MPNIKFKQLKEIKLPFQKDGVVFHSICKDNQFINVSYENKNFFLLLLVRGNEYLIKIDKVSRTTDVALMQKAISIFAGEFCDGIMHSNINTSHKYKSKPKYLKDESFFLDFKTDKKIFIEVGFGSGRHLIHQAKKNPNVIIIGIEIHTPSIYQTLNKLEEESIQNVFVVGFDARVLMEILPKSSASKIFVHFPVPWDKKEHRRVYSLDFIKNVTDVLEEQGTLELRSDSQNYFEYVYGLFNKLNHYNLQIFKNRELEIVSKYEDRWKKMQKDIYDVIFTNPSKTDDNTKINKKLIFNNDIDISDIIKKFKKANYRQNDIYINFEHLVEFSENEIAIKLSFGNGVKNEHLYIYIQDKKATYFPKKNILPIKSNELAHIFLEDWLYT